MAVLNRSLGRRRDWPQLESYTIAALAAGSANDPTADFIVGGVPDLKYSFAPGVLSQAGLGPSPGGINDLPVNRMAVRQTAFISSAAANTVGNATNNADLRLNSYRAGKLQGCIGYYPLSINTTLTSLAYQNVSATSSTTVTAGSVTITLSNATNVVVGQSLYVSGGTGTAEYITVTTIAGLSLTATFAFNHSGTYTLSSVVVNTTASTPIAAGSVAVTPVSMNGIVVNTALTITGGAGIAETVNVTAISSTTFTAVFANTHSGTYTVASPASVVGGQAVIPAATTNIVAGSALAIGSGATFEVVLVTSVTGVAFSANFQYAHANGEAVTAALVPYQQIPFIPANAIPATGYTSNSTVVPGSATIIPANIYGIHVGDSVYVSGGTSAEQVTATTVSGTALTATFAQTHAGTYNVAYYIATTVSNPGATPTVLTPASMAGLTVGQVLKLKGTGADSAVSDTVTVTIVGASTITITGAAGTYTTTANLTSVSYLSATTTTIAGKPNQVIAMASTTGIATGDLVALVNLVGNAATAAFTGTQEVVYVSAVVANTSITISPTAIHTNAFAVVPFTKTTSATAVTSVGAATITLASGTGFNTGQTGIYVFGGTATSGVSEAVTVTAVTAQAFTATFAQGHSGAYTLTTGMGGQTSTAGNMNYTPGNTPFELREGDVLTVTRLSNNATGLATPAGLLQIEWVPSNING